MLWLQTVLSLFLGDILLCVFLLLVSNKIWDIDKFPSADLTWESYQLMDWHFMTFQIVVCGEFFFTLVAREHLPRVLFLSVFHQCLARLLFDSTLVTCIPAFLIFERCLLFQSWPLSDDPEHRSMSKHSSSSHNALY